MDQNHPPNQIKYQCLICENISSKLFDVWLQNSFSADLYECKNCFFKFYPGQNWIQNSFSKRLNHLDVGAVDRTLIISEILTEICNSLGIKNDICLDYGGGYGLLTRIMRDKGFNWKNYDPYTEGIFSENHNCSLENNFALISLIEVCLHFEDPVNDFFQIIKHANTLIFTASIPKKPFDSNSSIVTKESGQHIAIYSLDSLKIIANKIGCHFYSDKKFIHIFTRKKLSLGTKLLIKFRTYLFLRIILRKIINYLLRSIGKNKSLIDSDQDSIKKMLEKN